ncbi:MAG: transporter substrate-binding domain-containing protein [Candidatus Delongbacteria bacterium]|nr:transporter substrate-binding domain-containing protein [Candidatus Delongbacteria bacterium]MBN2833943.1 transporter substrate-binding domain-containing protein [Candidatus Delongbacteria bacterium]
MRVFLVFITFFTLTQILFGEKVKIAVGLALPPYVLSDTNEGIELEIVKEALLRKGHDIELKYLPFARVVEAMKQKEVDAAMTIQESSGITDVYYSNSHIEYQNVVVSLAEKNYKIEKISDLSNKSVLAFQNAKLYLGEEFKNEMGKNPNYREIAQQENQVAMLFMDRADVDVVDINIFKYYKDKTTKTDTSLPIVFHEIFPKTNYKVAFKDQKIRDDFNSGLKEIKADGTYDKIFKKYIK